MHYSSQRSFRNKPLYLPRDMGKVYTLSAPNPTREITLDMFVVGPVGMIVLSLWPIET